MASTSNKKLMILYILQVLREYSDEQHPLTQAEIIRRIYSQWGMECERKAISSNIDCLIDFGFDIMKTKNGCYLLSREFESSEVSFLIDAVFSSKAINSSQSRELAKRLGEFLSVYQRKKYSYIYKADEITRTESKQIFYTIDILNEAIEKKKQVQFNYNRFYISGAEAEKKAARRYTINPYFLINSQGRYYLVCNNTLFDEITNYRVELISNITILDTPVRAVNTLKGCEKGVDIAKYANENIYMFHNISVDALLRLENSYAANAVSEWFGKNARYWEKDGELFASVKANEQALIYWCLQYGEKIELLEPAQTREKIKQILDKMQEVYSKEH